jgi:hypothetical protein
MGLLSVDLAPKELICLKHLLCSNQTVLFVISCVSTKSYYNEYHVPF